MALVLAATIAAFLMCLPVNAQVNTGRISGQVTDQTGGAISGAKVSVIEVARGESRDLVTDSAGQYAAPNLNPDIYTVRAEFMGFQTVERQNVEVTVGGDVRVDITLQPGATTQTVTVTESLPVINTTNAQTGGVLENQLITDLPLNGRNYRWEQALVPGVLLGLGTSSVTIDVNGTTDAHAGNSLVDGLYDQTYFTGEVTLGGSGEAGTATILPLDAVQEINLVVNPKAEYGWVPGVTTSIGIKSGTNEMHGDAYAFGRDTSLDARNPFAAIRTPVDFEQFGATLGGPIKKNKLFYFAGFEGFQESASSIVNIVGDPTDADLGQNAASALTSIPDAIAAVNAAKLPLSQLSVNLAGCNPTSPNITSTSGAAVALACASGNQFGAPNLWNNPNLGDVPDVGWSYNGLIKVDYHLNDHHQLSGSWGYGRYVEAAAGNSAAKITQSYYEEVIGAIGNMGRVVEIWTPNSSWLNEARWGRDANNKPVGRAECTPTGDPFTNPVGLGASTGNYGGPNYLTQYGLASKAPGCGIPTITLSNIGAQLGFSNGRADVEVDNQGADVVSYTRGSHQFKFGVDIRAISFSGAKTLDSLTGTAAFGGSTAQAFAGATSLEDFLAGEPNTETLRENTSVRNIGTNLIAAFIQDDWRITPRLTLNPGIREEIVTPPTSNGDNLGSFNPSTPSGLQAETHPWNTQYNFEPHFGLAWDVNGKGTTTVRAGIGVANALITLMNFISGGGTANFDNSPTGETLYAVNGASMVAPGNGASATQTLLPIIKSNIITSPGTTFWPTTNSAANPLFPSVNAACGNGLAPVAGVAGAPSVDPPACSVTGASPNLHYYHYISWNVNFEHAFTNNFSVDVGYVGTRSTGTLQTLNLNQPAPNITTTSSSTEQTLGQYYNQFPWFSTINYEDSSEGVWYRALQLRMVERTTHGLTFTTAYTYSADYLQQGVLNIHLPISGGGPYSENLYPAHNLSVTATYAVPGIKSPGQMLEGWQLHTNISVISSLPVVLTDTTDDLTGAGKSEPWTLYGTAGPFNRIFGRAGTIPCYGVSGVTTSGLKGSPCIEVPSGGAATPWSNLPSACILGASGEAPFTTGLAANATGSPLEQLALVGCYMVNGSAIVPPAQGTYGTMLPDAIRGPGLGTLDASITKEWKIKERYTTQFRVEAFNLLNRTQYSNAGVNLGSPTALGLATNTPDITKGDPIAGHGGSRDIQFGLKLLF